MRLRTTIPTATALTAGLLAAVIALPGQASAASPTIPGATRTITADGGNHPFGTVTPLVGPRTHALVTPADGTVPTPTVLAAVADATDQGLVLRATTDTATDPAVSVQAVLTNTADQTRTTVPLTAGADGQWSAPLSLPAYGTYTADITATDGATPAQASAAFHLDTVSYQTHEVVHATITPSVLDYEHQTIEAKGTVTLWDPATGDTGKAVGTSDPVVHLTGPSISDYWNWSSGGDFDLKYTVSDRTGFVGGLYQVYAEDGGVRTASVTAPVDMGSTSATRITLSPANSAGTAGKYVTVRGHVEYQDTAGAWHPAPNLPLDYGHGFFGNYEYYLGTTDSQGAFALQVSTPNTASSFSVSTDTSMWGWSTYLTPSSAVYTFTAITQQISLSASNATVDEFGQLQFQMEASSSNGRYPNGKIWVFVSPNGKTGWVNLGWVPAKGYMNVTIHGDAYNPHGFWRLYTQSATGYHSTYSNTVHAFRYETKLTGGKPNHTTVLKNHYLSFGGHLYRRGYGSWQAVKGSRVYLFFRPTGSKTWSVVTSVRTDSHGSYHLSAKAKRSGTWELAWFTPNQWYVDAFGPGTWVRVK